MEVKQIICQSCGMPLKSEDDFGTDQSGEKNREYCFYCFSDGKFSDEGITMEQKIEKNVKFAVQMGISEDSARSMAESIIPQLKRWKNQD